MARIRTIKPSFWEDEKIGALTPHARLLFVGSWNLADDAGRLRWTADYINVSLFMYDGLTSKRVAALMSEVEASALVLPYSAGALALGQITNWRKHQRINRPGPSQFPPHPSYAESFTESISESITPPAVNDSLGEGKGREEERNNYPPNPPPSGGDESAQPVNPRAAGTNPRANGARVVLGREQQRLHDQALAGARAVGANLAAGGATPEELEETFDRRFRADPELLEAARAGAAEIVRASA